MPKRDPNQKQVRYAVVGLGHISQVAMLPAFEHARENSKLTALVSSDQKKREELGKRYGVRDTYGYDQYQACLASGEVDAVYIALPNDKHREYAVRAAEAGVHVLCEKPLAPNEADCEAMIAAAAENGVQLMTAYRLHFDEGTLSTMELVRSGKLGASRIFESVFTMNITDQSNIRLTPFERGGGTVFDLGVYCINAARHYFGSEPYEVIASSANGGESALRAVRRDNHGDPALPGRTPRDVHDQLRRGGHVGLSRGLQRWVGAVRSRVRVRRTARAHDADRRQGGEEELRQTRSVRPRVGALLELRTQ